MSWTYADLATYDLLTTYGALEVTEPEVPTTPGRMTPRPVTGVTLTTVDAPGATITPRPVTGVTLTTVDAPGATITPRPVTGATIRPA